jgi:hypothetical protein
MRRRPKEVPNRRSNCRRLPPLSFSARREGRSTKQEHGKRGRARSLREAPWSANLAKGRPTKARGLESPTTLAWVCSLEACVRAATPQGASRLCHVAIRLVAGLLGWGSACGQASSARSSSVCFAWGFLSGVSALCVLLTDWQVFHVSSSSALPCYTSCDERRLPSSGRFGWPRCECRVTNSLLGLGNLSLLILGCCSLCRCLFNLRCWPW